MKISTTTLPEPSEKVREALAHLAELPLDPEFEAHRAAGLEVAAIMQSLDADDELITAAALHPLLNAKQLERGAAEQRFGSSAARLARDLGQLGRFGLSADWTSDRGLEAGQAEALRKMLIAVVADVRLVVVRLAEQVQKMRSAKRLGTEAQRALALETREVYAPLANRLGIWQLKWELEDLAFRYLEPGEYRHIAAALKSRRSDRERYMERLQSTLTSELEAAGIHASVQGRPKHIYSIWNKMQRKQIAFEQLTDIRAARILVDDVAECYAALGVVHSLWQFIPGEFDDYIATPKDNFYRSIHTAVLGPEGESIEIQIRTYAMHADSERGVASHWRYKEGGRSDSAYARKINQLRQLLAPAESGERTQDFLERVRVDLFQDRVYVLSPKGEIVDVPVGGTPLDFAYQVHTELGHRTRGAKVNGRIVPLNHKLAHGETVEIITGKTPQPSRDWLSVQSEFIASPRHRNKVRAWFRKQDKDKNATEGRGLLEREISRLGVLSPPLPEILSELNFADAQTLYEALGAGDITAAQVIGGIQRILHAREAQTVAPRGTRAPPVKPGVAVQGIGELLSTFARCCRAVPPEPIGGYIAVGRGVSIHTQSCRNFLRLAAKAPERVLAIEWGRAGERRFAVEIQVQAYDRRGLVRDISALIADDKISIIGMNTVTDQRENIASMRFTIEIDGLPQLARVLARIAQLPNVLSATRKK